jgi:hypothetical protein
MQGWITLRKFAAVFETRVHDVGDIPHRIIADKLTIAKEVLHAEPKLTNLCPLKLRRAFRLHKYKRNV